MVDWYKVIGGIAFFSIFLISFTLVPRALVKYLNVFLNFDKKMRFWKNLSNIGLTYILFGFSLAVIFYQTSNIGSDIIIKSIYGSSTFFLYFLSTLFILVSMRWSILMNKRWLLKKIPLIKKIESLVYKDSKEVKTEYYSFLFEIFFASFFLSIMIMSFKAIFVPEFTRIHFPELNKTLYEIYVQIWNFLKIVIAYLTSVIIITFISEIGLFLTKDKK